MFWHECDEQRKLARERKQERSQKKACPSSQIATTTTTKEAGAIKPVSKSRTHLFFPVFFAPAGQCGGKCRHRHVKASQRQVRDKRRKDVFGPETARWPWPSEKVVDDGSFAGNLAGHAWRRSRSRCGRRRGGRRRRHGVARVGAFEGCVLPREGLVKPQDDGNVPTAVAIVGCRPNGDQAAVKKLPVALHDQLVGPGNEREPVHVEELVGLGLPEKIACSSWRKRPSLDVLLWVGPEQVTHAAVVWDFLLPVDEPDFVQTLETRAQPAVDAENAVPAALAA